MTWLGLNLLWFFLVVLGLGGILALLALIFRDVSDNDILFGIMMICLVVGILGSLATGLMKSRITDDQNALKKMAVAENHGLMSPHKVVMTKGEYFTPIAGSKLKQISGNTLIRFDWVSPDGIVFPAVLPRRLFEVIRDDTKTVPTVRFEFMKPDGTYYDYFDGYKPELNANYTQYVNSNYVTRVVIKLPYKEWAKFGKL